MFKKFLILIVGLGLFVQPVLAQEFESYTAKAEVIEVKEKVTVERLERVSEMVEAKELKEQELVLELDDGEQVSVNNYLEGGPFDIDLEQGDKVFLQVSVDPEGNKRYEIRDFWYLDKLIWLALIALALILLFGGKQALRAILALGLSAVLIFYLFIPLLEGGYSPFFLTLLISFLITLVSLLIILGWSRKTLSAVLGTIGGVLLALIFGYLGGMVFLHLNGLGAEDSRILAASFSDYNFKGLLLAGFIIGALGACMDVAVSISSSLDEIQNHNSQITRKELFASGLKIGRDILGSMLNTLIFAYVGASLTLVLLLVKSGNNLLEILNYGFIVEEIVRSFVGALGLAATIPITAAVGAFVDLPKKR